MENSQIMWTHNTQNFWVGCDKIAPECAKCYIKRPLLMQGREPWGSVYRTSKKLWKDPLDWQQEAQEAHECLRIFTCSLSDFFHAKADPWRDEAWDIIKRTPHLVWLVLTKRPELIEKRLPKDWPYPNVWLGVSSGARMTLNKMDTLRGIPVHPKAVRFLSAEPLIEDISAEIDLTGFGWVIIGGESGSNPEYLWDAAGDWRKEFSAGGRRTMKIEWAAALRDKVKAAGLPLAFKQVTASRSGVGENALDRPWHEYPPPPLELPWAPDTDAAAVAPAEPEQLEGTLSAATVAAMAPAPEPTAGIHITDDDLQGEFRRGYDAGYVAHEALHAAMGTATSGHAQRLAEPGQGETVSCDEPRYFVQQYERKTVQWSRDKRKREIEKVTETVWGIWKHGSDSAKDEPDETYDVEEEARQRAGVLAKEDEKREAEERRIAEEEAEDAAKLRAALAALAGKGVAIPAHDPKVERLCRMVAKGINYQNQKRAQQIAKQLLTPKEPPKDEPDEDALIEQYDPDREKPEGRPTYKVMLTVTGSKLESMLKKAKEAFGEALLTVEKVSRVSSRADELADAIRRVSDAKDDIESLKIDIESWHENLPDSFRDGEKGSQLEECMEALEQVISSLDDAESNADSVEFPGMY